MAEPAARPSKAPWHLWIVGVVSLLWNAVGCMDFVMTQTHNKAYMSGFTPAQLSYYYGFPFWAVVAWGIAPLSALLGTLALFLRRRLAVALFAVSILGMVLTDIYSFVLSDGLKVMGGPPALILSAVIFVIGAFLLAYSRSMGRRGVLR